MKAKLYIGIIAAVLLPGFMAQAQIDDSGKYQNGYQGTVVNNYYDYDYFYASRINRFHRSFTTFNYYTPLFTDSYWYNYQPYSWGLSIYGGLGFGIGFSCNYPVYYDYGWNNSWFSSSYYMGYDPFYYNSWFPPVVFNFGFGNRWYHNSYSWNDHNHWDYDYRHNHNFYNNHYGKDYQYNNHSNNSNFTSRNESENNNHRVNNVSRRESSNYSQNDSYGTSSTGVVNSSVSRRAENSTYNLNSRNSNQVNSRNASASNIERRPENSLTVASNNRRPGQVSSNQAPSRRSNESSERKISTGRTDNSNSGVNNPGSRIPSYQAPALNRNSEFNSKRISNMTYARNENSRSASVPSARSNSNQVQRPMVKAELKSTRSVSNVNSASFKAPSSSRSSVRKSSSEKSKRR
jgi:hypothetical protein